jgi:hypothetical protein
VAAVAGRRLSEGLGIALAAVPLVCPDDDAAVDQG